MKLLLDTHAFIWFINGDNQLPKKVIKLIEDSNNQCYLSIASIWEIAIKVSLGRLVLKSEFNHIQQLIIKNDFEILPIHFDHLISIQKLEFFHRDPFDRLIISQAIAEDFIIISKDKEFSLYPIRVIW
jgi:PIN domain nuclease of toxin-antitoxin system